MTLPIRVPFLPMEASSVDKIPEGDNWQPLERYFPDVVEQVLALTPKRFVLDGEIVVPVDGDLSFDDLLMRIHPAASRIKKLASEPLGTRRVKLEDFGRKYFKAAPRVKLSPATNRIAVAANWSDRCFLDSTTKMVCCTTSGSGRA